MDERELITSINSRHNGIIAFVEKHPDLLVVLNSAFLVSNALAYGTTIEHGSKNLAKTFRGLMWQIASDYLKQSLIHILGKELDAGYALLRMACELARDAYVIGANENNIDLWLSREDHPQKYRKEFKFDRSSVVGSYAFDLYKISSKFGVHGHLTSFMEAGVSDKTPLNEGEVLIENSETTIFSGLQIWLRAIFPVHGLFCESFKLQEDSNNVPYKLFMDFVSSLEPILEVIDKEAGRKVPIMH